MENQRNSILSWYYCQGKTMEELRQSLLYTTLELEQTRLAAQEELRKRDDQLIHLNDLLTKTMKERDETQKKCQRLVFEKLLLQQQQLLLQQQQQQQNAPLSGISGIEDEPRKRIDSNNGFSSSDCEESIVSSPVIDPIPQPQEFPATSVPQLVTQTVTQQTVGIVPEKPLPEKGKLLQAVMKAGPLLKTLLLAGPLPEWRHPPPPSFEIPPVTIPSPPSPPPQLLHQDSFPNTVNGCNRKRVLCGGFDSSVETKHQRIVLQ
ncbi:hypothetical protein K2173_014065 [Erythroxylum novogranatense]|uniref:Uncharacterized protein n=1 Tax=Erythroxylum novogranatense TaxID=1862640 RepID=A0AAV8SDV9_9ROSI|nr:hypothetical protein K2173_014065 [Erythroxylum novogranatense]